jgi:indole-3-glycerol phosphate synthase/phosphoribosylanthranilate isomerase
MNAMRTNSKTDNVLNRIVAHKKQEVAERKQNRPLSDWKHRVPPCTPHQLERAFQRADVQTRLMLEIKPASPSMGVMQAELDLAPVVQAYTQTGVAISVLTDSRFFGGSLELLKTVAESTHLPVLCKDFILDPYQVYEARLAGASAVLLIVKMLTDGQLLELTQLIRHLGMTPLIEIQNTEELDRALKAEPSILLINNRNLETLEMDMSATRRLSEKIPPQILRVSASGIETRNQIAEIQPYCDGFLIGSALMKQPAELLPRKLEELLYGG